MVAEICFKLNTGAEIPAVGFGTWQSPPGVVKDAVSYALSIGYKHIDAGTIHHTPAIIILTLSSILLCQRGRSR